MPTTFRPAFAASVARCSPPGPRPMTTRSTAMSLLMGPSQHAEALRGTRATLGIRAVWVLTRGDLPLWDARTLRLPPARAAARAGQQADPVRGRRAELHGQGVGRRRRRHRALGADVPRRL